MIFDFRLKVFQTTAQKLSFTKAAAELFITQPAVSKHIHELEQHLGARLFKRNGNSISLTTAGEVLYKHAEKILGAYTLLESELSDLNTNTEGLARIGASTTVAQTILPKILALYKRSHPTIGFTFIQGNTDYITQQLIAEKIDIGIIEGVAHHPAVSYSPFAKDELVLVASSKSRLARKTEITPAELLTIPLVLREPGSGTLDVIYKALSQVNIQPKDLNVEVHFDSSASIKQYLLYSEAAAFLPIQTLINELKYNELSVIEIEGLDVFRTFQFIQLHGKTSKVVELFKRFCIANYNLK